VDAEEVRESTMGGEACGGGGDEEEGTVTDGGECDNRRRRSNVAHEVRVRVSGRQGHTLYAN
jgi:hypothetical protein